jgi:glycosyltransferase involved in cell wall biosynthesis
MALEASSPMPQVSVVIPCYDRVEWIPEALRSVLDQSEKDLEVILVDDGSSLDLAPWVATRDSRVRYVRQDNRGPSAARNRGIDLARGDYVAFLDSDDRFLPGKLQRQLATMALHPEVLLSHTSYERIAQAGEPLDVVSSGCFSGRVYPDLYAGCPVHTSTVMVRRAALGPGVRFDETVRIAEDILLWARFAKHGPILGIDEPLSQVRRHPRNAALDPASQIVGLGNLLTLGVRRDPALPWVVRQQLTRRLYGYMAFMYQQQGRRGRAAVCRTRAALAWPFDARPIRGAARMLPAPARRRLKSLLGVSAPRDGAPEP